MPGVRVTTAWSLVAELGTNPEQFPQSSHLASWAGMCPGNNESAGKRKSGKTRKGNRWLRRALNQAAWAAVRTKNTYFAARFHRLAAKRGSKRAIVAVGHKILVLAHYLLHTTATSANLAPTTTNGFEHQASHSRLSVDCNASASKSRSHLLHRQAEHLLRLFSREPLVVAPPSVLRSRGADAFMKSN